eukprot:CCRYP_017001-RE/>CCRYP_017001-RE protein AED:0.45 eAED:1.00 QI:0/0/0/1/0/0/2/0/257
MQAIQQIKYIMNTHGIFHCLFLFFIFCLHHLTEAKTTDDLKIVAHPIISSPKGNRQGLFSDDSLTIVAKFRGKDARRINNAYFAKKALSNRLKENKNTDDDSNVADKWENTTLHKSVDKIKGRLQQILWTFHSLLGKRDADRDNPPSDRYRMAFCNHGNMVKSAMTASSERQPSFTHRGSNSSSHGMLRYPPFVYQSAKSSKQTLPLCGLNASNTCDDAQSDPDSIALTIVAVSFVQAPPSRREIEDDTLINTTKND